MGSVIFPSPDGVNTDDTSYPPDEDRNSEFGPSAGGHLYSANVGIGSDIGIATV